MKIIHAKDVPYVNKPEGSNVGYYLFKDYEVMYVAVSPHTEQTWHHHEIIWETGLIIDGELTVVWREDGSQKQATVGAGDVIESERSPHNYINNTDYIVRMITIKRIPSKKDYSEVFKADKILD